MMSTGLKLAALASLLALAAALPMFVAGIPCLSHTAPPNALGGRLGTLTDLSLLRLLDALDPSPESLATSNAITFPVLIRALPSTIQPAVSSARTRLIILLVIIAVFGGGGGLFLIARAYAAFARYRTRFEDMCGGLDMVFVSAKDTPAWTKLSEERIKRWLGERFHGASTRRSESTEINVIGVFAVP